MEGSYKSRKVLDERTERDMEATVPDRMRQPLIQAHLAQVSQRTAMELPELVSQSLVLAQMTSLQTQDSPFASTSISSEEEERSQSKGSRSSRLMQVEGPVTYSSASMNSSGTDGSHKTSADVQEGGVLHGGAAGSWGSSVECSGGFLYDFYLPGQCQPLT
ncbi:hypothetical protein ABVT39_005984 [Epinephelus coioides]